MTSNPTKDMSHVAKFDGTNFQFWKFQVTLLLEQHDLIDGLLREFKVPIRDGPMLVLTKVDPKALPQTLKYSVGVAHFL